MGIEIRVGRQVLAATGATGNNTHTSVEVKAGSQAGSRAIGFQFVVEAVGTTPTVTWSIQGSYDNVNFYAIPFVTDATATESVTARAATVVGTQVEWLALSGTRQFPFYRLVTTLNTNVTYRADVYWERV